MAQDHDDWAALGRRLNAFRRVRGLSLRALGGATGTTASFLSQLERGASGATVSTLMRIAEALSISMSDLFEDSDPALHRVLRRGDRPALPQASGYRKTLLSQPPIRAFEVYVGSFDPQGSTGPDPYTHGDAQEMMFVLQGQVEITLGPERFVLSEGDSIEYRSSTPHRIANAGDGIAEVQWIISPATSAKAELDEFTRESNP